METSMSHSQPDISGMLAKSNTVRIILKGDTADKAAEVILKLVNKGQIRVEGAEQQRLRHLSHNHQRGSIGPGSRKFTLQSVMAAEAFKSTLGHFIEAIHTADRQMAHA
jgi:hypothetical protein